MIRRLALLGLAVLIPVGAIAITSGQAFAPAVKYANGTDTVQCASFFGSASVSPELSITGSSPDTIKIKGVLDGCTDGNGALNGKDNPANPYFDGKVAGTLTGTTNNLSALNGCSSAAGTLKISWSATAGASEALTYTSTLVNVTNIDGVQATSVPTPLNSGSGSTGLVTEGYGEFLIGYLATTAGGGSCSASATETEGFLGNDSGASSTSAAITSQDVNGILYGQEDSGTSTTKSTLGLGLGDLYSG